MAGSRKWVAYTADNSNKYSVQLDESNSELTGFTDITIADEIAGTVPPPLPKGYTMRYVNVKDGATGSSRRLWVGSPTHPLVTGAAISILLWAFTGATDITTAISWAVTSFVGEITNERRPNSADTGFVDGDATQV